MQSKDLMFSISKNPQASMAKVLAKAEKYINGEEALILKKKAGQTSDKDRAPKTKRPGKVSKERWRTVPEKAWKPHRLSGPTSTRETITLFTSAVHPLNSLSITSPARSAKRTVLEVANSNEVRPRHKIQHQVLRVP